MNTKLHSQDENSMRSCKENYKGAQILGFQPVRKGPYRTLRALKRTNKGDALVIELNQSRI